MKHDSKTVSGALSLRVVTQFLLKPDTYYFEGGMFFTKDVIMVHQR